MLKGIDPCLNADLLYVLRAMGHGDDIVIADTNFPADSVAAETVHGRLIRMDGVPVPRAIEAILKLMPLDSFVEHPVERMEVVGEPDRVLPIMDEVQAVVDRAEARHWPMGSVERHAFYARARQAYAVVQTGERRFYGCFILKMGVIPPDS